MNEWMNDQGVCVWCVLFVLWWQLAALWPVWFCIILVQGKCDWEATRVVVEWRYSHVGHNSVLKYIIYS
jgi:hypothetical protein